MVKGSREETPTTSAFWKPVACIILGSVSEKTKLTLAALASAAMPDVQMTGARDCDQISHMDRAEGISSAVVQDSMGNTYDVWAADQEVGKQRMAARVKAARALEDAKEVAAMGFRVEQVLAYEPGLSETSPTGRVSVTVMRHCPGRIRPLHLLTVNECTAAGTAIGAIHRIRPDFLKEHRYPAFTTVQISSQLQGWIKRLRKDGHVPEEITDSWASIVETDGLWSFDTCTVHGGFSDGDLLFADSGLSAVYGWQDIQVNDPARDLAWIFSKLDGSRRNAVIAAYGRMVGSRLDDLIMLRANLWLQMEQVGEFITALDRADNERIIQFKAQVERLAQQLSDHEQASRAHEDHKAAKPGAGSAPSTITVGTLLKGEDEAKPRTTGSNGTSEAAENGSSADTGTKSDDRTHIVRPEDKTNESRADEDKVDEPAGDSSVTVAISKVDMVDLAQTQTAMDHMSARVQAETQITNPATGQARVADEHDENTDDEKNAGADKPGDAGTMADTGLPDQDRHPDLNHDELPNSEDRSDEHQEEEPSPDVESADEDFAQEKNLTQDENPSQDDQSSQVKEAADGDQAGKKEAGPAHDEASDEFPLTGTETIVMPRKPDPKETPTRTTDGIVRQDRNDAQGVIDPASE